MLRRSFTVASDKRRIELTVLAETKRDLGNFMVQRSASAAGVIFCQEALGVSDNERPATGAGLSNRRYRETP